MSLTGAKLLGFIHSRKLRVFNTADIMTLSGASGDLVTHALRRLEAENLVTHLKRGVWLNRVAVDLNPFEAVPFLTAPWPSYVSLYSALADYGVISEIPQVIYAVSSAPPKRYKTPIADYQVHHLSSNLIWGYENRRTTQGSYPLAEAEKAFLDLVYLSLVPRSSLSLPSKRGRRWNLNQDKIKKQALRFDFPPLIDYLKKIKLWANR